MRNLIIADALALGATVPASAQLVGGGLVVVNISNVANNIAEDLDVNVSDVPVTVQVPVSVAAVVCNVEVAVLSRLGPDGALPQCNARSTNDALNQIVQGQILDQ